MCLACEFRVMSEQAQVGFPEVKLGIYPGFGGTVRAPRRSAPGTLRPNGEKCSRNPVTSFCMAFLPPGM